MSARMNWLGPFSWRMGPLRKTWSAVDRVRTKVSLVAVSVRIQVPWNVLIVVPRSVLVTTSLNSPPAVRVRVTWTPPLTRGGSPPRCRQGREYPYRRHHRPDRSAIELTSCCEDAHCESNQHLEEPTSPLPLA